MIVGNVPGHGGQALGRRPAEAGALRRRSSGSRACSTCRRRGSRARWTTGADPLTPITVKTAVARGPGRLPLRAPVRVPRRPDPADVPAPLPLPVARRAAPRLRRRDLAEELKRERRPRATARATRSARRGSRPPSTSTSAARPGGADPRRLARPAAEPARAARDARPGHAVRLTIDIALQRAAERALRYGIAARPGERLVLRERRRDRRARPARRRGARDGLVPDVQAVRLRRPGRPEEDRSRSSTTRRRRRRTTRASTARRTVSTRRARR